MIFSYNYFRTERQRQEKYCGPYIYVCTCLLLHFRTVSGINTSCLFGEQTPLLIWWNTIGGLGLVLKHELSLGLVMYRECSSLMGG